uniref:Transposase Tc1-like domain-containing protein n=1 Tax=Neolamprologus brichardi TaxID=32507 RepID=A0A3Q4G265_NEOBR
NPLNGTETAADCKGPSCWIHYCLFAETGTYRMRQGRGRKQKLTDADVQHLKILSTSDRRKTTADLQVELNASRAESEKVSRMTISRRLNEQGLKGRVAAKKQLLRPINIQKRLRLPRERKHWTVDDWNKVLWTDELHKSFIHSKSLGTAGNYL